MNRLADGIVFFICNRIQRSGIIIGEITEGTRSSITVQYTHLEFRAIIAYLKVTCGTLRREVLTTPTPLRCIGKGLEITGGDLIVIIRFEIGGVFGLDNNRYLRSRGKTTYINDFGRTRTG